MSRVLPGVVYDGVKASAEKYGGIGAGRCTKDDAPWCYYGHVDHAKLWDGLGRDYVVSSTENDNAVRKINRARGGTSETARVPFEAWAQELGVVRGEG